MEYRYSFFTILLDIPLLNSSTCRRIYLRKASEDHRPISIIMKTGVSSMNIAIAAADLIDFVPISSEEYPNVDFPMLSAF